MKTLTKTLLGAVAALVAGEAACVSVHGANRLGSNSLLDLVIFGRSVADRCGETIKPNSPHKDLPAAATDAALANFDRVRNAKGSTSVPDDTARVRRPLRHTQRRHSRYRNERRTDASTARGYPRTPSGNATPPT